MTKKSFIISALTVLIQYYDYHLFGFLAANIAKHFFSSNEAAIQILHTYFIMSLAMMAKPIGAIIFGKIGDSLGRSVSFKISLAGTAIASIILGLIPSYEIIGIFSAIILLICRMVICTLVSSGSDGVRLYLYENIAASKRGLSIGITTSFMQAGTLIASLSAWFFTLNTMPSYSWRFAFLIGGGLGLIMLYIMKINNFSDNNKINKKENFDQFQKMSITQIIQKDYKLFILCLILAGSIGSTYQFIIIFFGTYNFEILKILDRSVMQQYTSVAIICYLIFCIISGYLTDLLGAYNVFKAAIKIVLILAISLCYITDVHNFSVFIYICVACSLPFITMPAALIYKRSIPIVIRYRFFSLSHAIGSILISAPTAFISTYLYHETKISWLPIGYFIITLLMIFLSIYFLNKREFKD